MLPEIITEFLPKIYKGIPRSIRETKNLLEKWAKALNRQCTEEKLKWLANIQNFTGNKGNATFLMSFFSPITLAKIKRLLSCIDNSILVSWVGIQISRALVAVNNKILSIHQLTTEQCPRLNIYSRDISVYEYQESAVILFVRAKFWRVPQCQLVLTV